MGAHSRNTLIVGPCSQIVSSIMHVMMEYKEMRWQFVEEYGVLGDATKRDMGAHA